MKASLSSKHFQSPYVVIGLDLTDNYILTQFRDGKSIDINQLFDALDDCEHFIEKQINNEKLVLIISGYLSNEQLTKLKSYSQIDAIYSYSKSADLDEDLKCIYTKATQNKYLKIFLNLLKTFWFILGIFFVLLCAYLFPRLGASGGIIHAEYTVKYGCVIIIFFLSGLSLPTKNLIDQLFHFRLHILIQVLSLLVVPFTVFGIALLLAKTSLNKALITGIMVMASTCTSISTNVILVRNAGGNDYAALLNALFGNILGVFVTPAMIFFFMSTAGLGVVKQAYDIVSYLHVVGTLSLTVLLPLVIGLIINRIWTEKLMWAKVKFHFTEINSVALLILVWAVYCDLFLSGLLKTVNTYDLLIVMALNATFYISFSLFALLIGRLPNLCVCRKESHDEKPLLEEHQPKKPSWVERWRFSREDTIALMFCSSTKTLAKGVPVIAAVFANSNQGLVGLLSLPLILYHIEQLILGSIEVLLLQRWLKKHYKDDSKDILQK